MQSERKGDVWSKSYGVILFLLIIISQVNDSQQEVSLKYPGETREFVWKPGESLLWRLETEKIVKELLILHGNLKKKKLSTFSGH